MNNKYASFIYDIGYDAIKVIKKCIISYLIPLFKTKSDF